MWLLMVFAFKCFVFCHCLRNQESPFYEQFSVNPETESQTDRNRSRHRWGGGGGGKTDLADIARALDLVVDRKASSVSSEEGLMEYNGAEMRYDWPK